MRLLLDAHVSGRRIGARLTELGHDVRALDGEPGLDGLDDEEVLALAWSERRILVAFNVADFPDILRDWAAGDRRHAGVILLYGIGHGEFALVVRGIERMLFARPDPDAWVDYPAVLDRGSAEG